MPNLSESYPNSFDMSYNHAEKIQRPTFPINYVLFIRTGNFEKVLS